MGQPIRLTGGEMTTQPPAGNSTNLAARPDSPSVKAASPSASDGLPQPLPISGDQPAQLPDIASLSQLNEPTVQGDSLTKKDTPRPLHSPRAYRPRMATKSPPLKRKTAQRRAESQVGIISTDKTIGCGSAIGSSLRAQARRPNSGAGGFAFSLASTDPSSGPSSSTKNSGRRHHSGANGPPRSDLFGSGSVASPCSGPACSGSVPAPAQVLSPTPELKSQSPPAPEAIPAVARRKALKCSLLPRLPLHNLPLHLATSQYCLRARRLKVPLPRPRNLRQSISNCPQIQEISQAHHPQHQERPRCRSAASSGE